MLSHGLKHLVTMRISAGAFIIYRVLALVLGYAALVFLPALAVRRNPREIAPALPELTGPVSFGATVLVVYSLVLPAVGVFSALRSSAALLPVVSVLVVIAILRTAEHTSSCLDANMHSHRDLLCRRSHGRSARHRSDERYGRRRPGSGQDAGGHGGDVLTAAPSL